MRPGQMIFIDVTDVINPHWELAEELRDRVLEAAEFIPCDGLGTTDDGGFSPFCDDQSDTRDTPFAKIKPRVEGTKLAKAVLLSRTASR